MTALPGVHTYSSDPAFDKHVPSELFHYTSSDGLKGIIENGELWATDRSFLNDTAESMHGSEVVVRHFDQLKQQISSEYPANTEIAEMFDAYVESLTENQEVATKASWFVASLCEEPNLLTQWIGYGHQGGYSVGFDALGLRQKGESLSEDKKYVLRRVIYHPESQLGELLKTAQHYVLDKVGKTAAQKEQALNLVVVEALVDLLRYKDSSFEREQEWRVWRLGPGSSSEMSFRTNPTLGIIPFVKFDIGQGRDSLIRKVWIGPTALGEESVRAVRLLLDSNELQHVEIERSEISLRW